MMPRRYWYIRGNDVYEFTDAPAELFNSFDEAWNTLRHRKAERIEELKAELALLTSEDMP